MIGPKIIMLTGPVFGSPTEDEAKEFRLGFSIDSVPRRLTTISVYGFRQDVEALLAKYQYKKWPFKKHVCL